jgi:hypothetical protein
MTSLEKSRREWRSAPRTATKIDNEQSQTAPSPTRPASRQESGPSMRTVRRDIALIMTVIVGALAIASIFLPTANVALDKVLPMYAVILTYYFFVQRSRIGQVPLE